MRYDAVNFEGVPTSKVLWRMDPLQRETKIEGGGKTRRGIVGMFVEISGRWMTNGQNTARVAQTKNSGLYDLLKSPV